MTLSAPDPHQWRAAVSGERAARQELLRTWLPVVTDWCDRLGGPSVDAEDAAAEVAVLLLTRLERIREPERLPAWLFTTTRRVLWRHRQYAWVRRWVPGATVERVDPSRDPLALSSSRQTVARVRALLEQLPARDREIIVLCDVEDRPDSEVATLLGIPKNTAKTRLFRARRRLRALAEAEGVLPSLHLMDGGGS